MRRALYTTLFLLGCISTTTHASLIDPIQTFPSLPSAYRENKFHDVQTAFEERCNLFLKGKHFQNWKPNKPQKEIAEEFKRIEDWRNHSWYSDSTGNLLISRPDFMIAQELLEKGHYRRPNLIAFHYNQTDGSYNSSSIVLNGQHFLALEAPTRKTVSQFFKLLQNFQVTQLVRLTPTEDQNNEQSDPYWIDRVKVNKTGSVLQIPLLGTQKTLPVRYYVMENWPENQGIDPHALLRLILAVRKDYDPKGLLACHCKTGTAKAGTFIAGFILLQEIDRQIASGVKIENLDISIEKIVFQLSLQRLQMVAKPAQYLSLYRLVDLYVQGLKK